MCFCQYYYKTIPFIVVVSLRAIDRLLIISSSFFVRWYATSAQGSFTSKDLAFFNLKYKILIVFYTLLVLSTVTYYILPT